MNGRFKPRMDILPPAQRRLWPELGPITDHAAAFREDALIRENLKNIQRDLPRWLP